MKTRYKLLGAFIFLALIASCSEKTSVDSTKQLEMAILTDVHVYADELDHAGEEFRQAEMHEIKMFEMSEALLDRATDEIITYKPQVALVCGDLTKDGGVVNHQKVIQYLKKMKDAGIKVCVIPGNHDIGGDREAEYTSAGPVPLETVSTTQFAELYSDYGYDEAVAKDPGSLSYVVEPVEGIRIIGIDACNYPDASGALRFDNLSWVDGKIDNAGKAWVLDQITEARNKDKYIFAFMHHGLVEHFPQQEFVFGEYLITDWNEIAGELADAGLDFVFTGHNHASDISVIPATMSGEKVYDIQTNATVSWNSTWREATLDLEKYTLSTDVHPITSIPYAVPGGDFVSYSDNFNREATELTAEYMLKSFGLNDAEIEMIMPLVVETLTAYRQGNEPGAKTEQISDMIDQLKQAVSQAGNPTLSAFVAILEAIWNDSTPDNKTTINL